MSFWENKFNLDSWSQNMSRNISSIRHMADTIRRIYVIPYLFPTHELYNFDFMTEWNSDKSFSSSYITQIGNDKLNFDILEDISRLDRNVNSAIIYRNITTIVRLGFIVSRKYPRFQFEVQIMVGIKRISNWHDYTLWILLNFLLWTSFFINESCIFLYIATADCNDFQAWLNLLFLIYL
jgi:hypothetical protein